jgi:hypothetical protein
VFSEAQEQVLAASLDLGRTVSTSMSPANRVSNIHAMAIEAAVAAFIIEDTLSPPPTPR